MEFNFVRDAQTGKAIVEEAQSKLKFLGDDERGELAELLKKYTMSDRAANYDIFFCIASVEWKIIYVISIIYA